MDKEYKLLTQEIKNFDIASWKGQYAFEYFARINSFLTQTNSTFTGLLAQPIPVSREGRLVAIDWVGHLYAKTAQLHTWRELKLAYPTLAQRVSEFLDYISSLNAAETAEEQRWGALLSLLMARPDEYQYFVQGQDVVIAGWGSIQKATMSPIGIEYMTSETILEESHPNSEHLSHPETDTHSEDALSSTTELNVSALFDRHEPPIFSDSFRDEFADQHETPDITNAFQHDNRPDLGIDETLQQGEDLPPASPPVKDSNDKRGCRRFWWLLLLLPLLVLVWRQCADKSENANLLPKEPGVIPPIDSNEVVVDEDTIRTIIGNRVNVVLKRPNTDIQQFAREFKKAYPADAFEIIYYDTLTHRLQIQVPVEERERFMKELPDKMTEFKLLIWHESIFERNHIPSDPEFRSSANSWYFPVIKAPGAWDKTLGDQEVIVAVIDDGFDLSHPELKGRIVSPWNVVERSTNVFTNARSVHGSHVAGTALANKDNGGGLAGIAPLCSFMPIQVADRNGLISSTAVIDALLYAIGQGADVVNMSLGLQVDKRVALLSPALQYGIIDNFYLDEEAFWGELLQMAEENGTIIVMAAGNENILAGIDPMQRSPLAIKVAAVDQYLNKAGFSNYGGYATVCAPGVDIFSSVPGNKYAHMQGTSMAAPMVSGGIALLKSAKPGLTPQELRNIIVQTGVEVSNAVGPLIQLDAALNAAIGNVPIGKAPAYCTDVQHTIDSLLQLIDLLRRQCPNLSTPDTMMMPDIIDNLDFTIGRWKSTTYLRNNDGDQVTIYFDLYSGGRGKITLVEPSGIQCSAPVHLNIQKNSFVIDQPNIATCVPGNDSYSNYYFRCEADADGVVQCHAQNKHERANRFDFNLIKIQ